MICEITHISHLHQNYRYTAEVYRDEIQRKLVTNELNSQDKEIKIHDTNISLSWYSETGDVLTSLIFTFDDTKIIFFVIWEGILVINPFYEVLYVNDALSYIKINSTYYNFFDKTEKEQKHLIDQIGLSGCHEWSSHEWLLWKMKNS